MGTIIIAFLVDCSPAPYNTSGDMINRLALLDRKFLNYWLESYHNLIESIHRALLSGEYC